MTPLGFSSASITLKSPAAAMRAGFSKAKLIPAAGRFLDSKTNTSPLIGEPAKTTRSPLISILSTPTSIFPVALSVADQSPL